MLAMNHFTVNASLRLLRSANCTGWDARVAVLLLQAWDVILYSWPKQRPNADTVLELLEANSHDAVGRCEGGSVDANWEALCEIPVS